MGIYRVPEKRVTRTVSKKNGKKTVTTRITGKKGTSVTRTKTKGGGTKTKSVMGHVGKGGKVGVTRHKTKKAGAGTTSKKGYIRSASVDRTMGKDSSGKRVETRVGTVNKVKKKATRAKTKSTMGHAAGSGITRHKSKSRAGKTKRYTTDTGRRRTIKNKGTTRKS